MANTNDNTVSVYRNLSSGPGNIVFAQKVDYPACGYPRALAVGDFNGDGKPEIAVVGYTNSGTNLVILTNMSTPGTVAFSSPIEVTTANLGNLESIALGDFNGDGKLDIAVGSEGNTEVLIFKNNSTSGSISFTQVTPLTSVSDPRQIAIADLNGDGLPDIAVISASGLTENFVYLFQNAGSAVFNLTASYSIGSGSTPVTLLSGDINGDGRPYLAVGNYATTNVVVFQNISQYQNSACFVMKVVILSFVGLTMSVLSTTAQAQFDYVTNADETSVTITGYLGPDTVIIPSTINSLTVSGIGEDAFYGEAITGITIPLSVTSIGEEAFDGCLSLTNIDIPSSVNSIGIGAFNASGLTSLTIPATATNIEEFAFAGCDDLTNLSFAMGVTDIQSNIFGACESLASVIFPSSVTNIGAGAFGSCNSLTKLFFTGNAPGVGYFAFEDFPNVLSGPGVSYYTATAYYLPGTTGWAEFTSNTIIYSNRYQPTTVSVPTALWNPSIQASGTNFGIQNGQYGFDITATTNLPIAIEACDDLAQTNWTVLKRLTLSSGLYHFSKPFQINAPMCFYRIGFP